MIFNPVIRKSSSVAASRKDVNFYDYDGTLLYSYTLSEARALTALPKGPTHDGLVFQGWNWPLEKVKALTRPMNVGAMYITGDGKTRLKIHVWDKARSNVPLYISQTVANGVAIDWGDGSAVETLDGTGSVNTSHQYAAVGDYTIALTAADGCTLGFGNGTVSCCVMGSTGDTGKVYCNLLQGVNIGDHVTSIGSYAFYCCYSLASITIPEGVTGIGGSAFSTCYSLTGMTIPEGVTGIGSYAFSACCSLTGIAVPDYVTSIGSSAFNGCAAVAGITIPEGVTSIGNQAFQGCRALTGMTLPNGVTRIGNSAFNGCRALTGMTIPEGVTSVGSQAFQDCYSLASITIPEGVASIGNQAFQDCCSLVGITIPDHVTSIGSTAFSNCCGMAEYHLKSTTPPTLDSSNAFENIPSDCVIYVPAGSLEEYRTAADWSAYAGYLREEPA